MADRKKKRSTKRQQQKRKLIIFGVEILSVLLLLGLLYVWSIVSKMQVDSGFDNSEAGINEDIAEETLETLEGYTNIAIFGLDNRLVTTREEALEVIKQPIDWGHVNKQLAEWRDMSLDFLTSALTSN